MIHDARIDDRTSATLAYERVPTRPRVERFDGGARLIVPNTHRGRATVLRELPAFVMLALPGLLIAAGWFLFGITAGALVLATTLTAFALVTLAVLLRRRGATATVLTWDGEHLTLERGDEGNPGDAVRWSRAALADLTTHPVAGNVFGWPGLHAVRVVSRFDYAADVGAYPAGPLREAVAEFRGVVFGDGSV